MNVKTFLSKEVYPYANDLDKDTYHLKKIFNEFKKLKYFSLYVPEQYGGTSLTHHEKIEFQEAMGSMGGAFAFLQVQLATPCWLLQQSNNEVLKKHYLTSIAEGKITLGNVTSHMKPKNKIKIKGYKEKNGYRVSGKINFATGLEFFDELVIGFSLRNNLEAFAIIPFKKVNIDDGEIKINSIIDTISMTSMNTVSITLENYLIPNKNVILIWPKQTFFNMYKEFLPFAYTIGIATEALSLAKKSSILKNSPNLKKKIVLLQKKLSSCRIELKRMPQKITSDKLFAHIINVTWLCIQFSLLVSGGVGLLNINNIQRLYREIVIWFIPRCYPTTIELWIDKLIK